jgi:hypothetical protein
MKSKLMHSAFVIASLLVSTDFAAAQGTSGSTGAIASIPSSVVRAREQGQAVTQLGLLVLSPVRLRLALMRFRNKKRSGAAKTRCPRSRK